MKSASQSIARFIKQKLKEFPEELKQNVQITNLNLRNNEIWKIPEWIKEFRNLKVLYLSNNHIPDFEILGQLPKLEVLELNHNQLRSIPSSIKNLVKLKRLDLSNNNISTAPKELGNLKELKYLLMAHNQVKHLHAEIGQASALLTLNLFNNQLTEIPPTIGDLSRLAYLQLSKNKLTSLPDSLGNLNSLTHLHLFTNKVEKLPASLSSLKNLESLNVGDNKISRLEHIPESVKELSIYINPLEYFDLNMLNQFKSREWEHCSNFVFADSIQVEKFGLNEFNLEKKLRILDMETKKIPLSDFKRIPIELQQEWGILREKPHFHK